MRKRVSSLGSAEPLSQFDGRVRFNLSSKARVFFGIITIFAWTYGCSSSALAEVEEDTRQGTDKPGYSVSTLSNNIITNLIIDSYTDQDVAGYLSSIDGHHNDADLVNGDAEKYTGSHSAFSFSTNLHGFDDALIPETVWSLDVSTGAHLDHISGGPDSEGHTVLGGGLEINDLWIRTMFGAWNDNNTYRASGLLIRSSELQVASCGGSSAEHSDLDYCSDVKLASDQLSDPLQKSEQSSNNTATQGDNNNNVLSSGNGPSSDASAQPIIAPSIPAIADKAMSQGTLSILGACDVSASCASVPIDPMETPVGPLVPDPLPFIGDPTPLIDLPNPEALPPGPIIYVDDPGSDPNLPPVFIPQPLKPIPEASTWVMTIIGFSIIAFFFGRKRRPRINPISIIDVPEV